MVIPRRVPPAIAFVGAGLAIVAISAIVAAYSCIKIEDVAFSAMCVVAIMLVSMVIMIPLFLRYQQIISPKYDSSLPIVDDKAFWAAIPSNGPSNEDRICIVCLQCIEKSERPACEDWGESACCRNEFHRSCMVEYFRHRQTVICPVCRYNSCSPL